MMDEVRLMLKRKIYDKLLYWKKTGQGHSVLLIDGAKNVGKSCITKTLAENEYKSYVQPAIDFSYQHTLLPKTVPCHRFYQYNLIAYNHNS